jgi:ABC-type branched-subunit amino acid transport system substrate-binding protein
MKRSIALFACVAAACALAGCGDKPAEGDAAKKPAAGEQKAATAEKKAAPAIKTDKGVDVEKKTIRMGALNDESGPAAAIGKPYAIGKRILAAQVNAGGSGLLPDGWKVELVEKDHGYDPARSQQSFDAIKDDVLFIGTSFGTPATLPLRPFLQKERIVAYPASLSSQMAEHELTPPAGPEYSVEAMRAVEWAAETAGGADTVKAGIIYDQSDYGTDGLKGFEKATAAHSIAVAGKRAIKPGQKDFTADITELKQQGATHVVLAILPSSSGPVLGTAAKMQFGPTWIGLTPSWIDAFFAHPKLPAPVFANFHWVTGMPYWGEDVPGMKGFLAAFEKHGKAAGGRPDFYTLMSYLQGVMALEAAKRAIEARDVTREGYVKALHGIEDYTAGGMLQPISLDKVPYVVSTRVRILKPDFEKNTWAEAAPYATPKAMGGEGAAKAPAEKAQ